MAMKPTTPRPNARAKAACSRLRVAAKVFQGAKSEQNLQPTFVRRLLRPSSPNPRDCVEESFASSSDSTWTACRCKAGESAQGTFQLSSD